MRMGIILIIVGGILLILGAIMTFGHSDSESKEKDFATATSTVIPNTTDNEQEENKIGSTNISQVENTVINDNTENDTLSSFSENKNAKTAKEKGNDFEGHFADILKASSCRLLEWNQGATSPGGAYAENELNPDFLVAQNARGMELKYWVECKYRSTLPKEGFTLKDYQLTRYNDIQKKSKRKVIVALGTGGSSEAPEAIYLIPLDSLTRFKRIGHKYLSNYLLHNPKQNLSSHMESWFFNEVFTKSK